VSTLADLTSWWANWFTGVHGSIATHVADPAPTFGPAGTPFPGGDLVGLGLFSRGVADAAGRPKRRRELRLARLRDIRREFLVAVNSQPEATEDLPEYR
jgi:hypothetical protein